MRMRAMMDLWHHDMTNLISDRLKKGGRRGGGGEGEGRRGGGEEGRR